MNVCDLKVYYLPAATLLVLVLCWIGAAGETSGLTGLPHSLVDKWFDSIPEAYMYIYVDYNSHDI